MSKGSRGGGGSEGERLEEEGKMGVHGFKQVRDKFQQRSRAATSKFGHAPVKVGKGVTAAMAPPSGEGRDNVAYPYDSYDNLLRHSTTVAIHQQSRRLF